MQRWLRHSNYCHRKVVCKQIILSVGKLRARVFAPRLRSFSQKPPVRGCCERKVVCGVQPNSEAGVLSSGLFAQRKGQRCFRRNRLLRARSSCAPPASDTAAKYCVEARARENNIAAHMLTSEKRSSRGD